MIMFRCPSCASVSFKLNGHISDETEARCANCDALLGHWGAFRRELEVRLVRAKAEVALAKKVISQGNLARGLPSNTAGGAGSQDPQLVR
jgi:hypothetical protein